MLTTCSIRRGVTGGLEHRRLLSGLSFGSYERGQVILKIPSRTPLGTTATILASWREARRVPPWALSSTCRKLSIASLRNCCLL